MKAVWLTILAIASLADLIRAQETLFQDDFKGKLGQGWSWVREHSGAWRVTEHGLEVLVEPGNMWGPQNDARNLLVRPAPATTNIAIEIAVTVENQPTNQYEQVPVLKIDICSLVTTGYLLINHATRS